MRRQNRIPTLLCALAIAVPAFAQETNRQNLPRILGFENGTPGQFPAGWGRVNDGGIVVGDIVVDNKIAHSGRYSARLQRTASTSGDFSSLIVTVPLDFAGDAVELRGFIKTENVDGFVALWLREDDATGNVAFATLQGQNINGTADWKEYAVRITLAPRGSRIVFGFLIAGTGVAWVDDLQLLTDGQPVATAAPRTPTILDADHEFDSGSKISIDNLSETQVKNVAKLSKVWGFLKYHHPAVTGGARHWDYELFRVLPRILAASDAAEANATLLTWISGLGPVDNCTGCAALRTADLHLAPDLDWLADEALLGTDLSHALSSIYRNRSASDSQFFVSLEPGVLQSAVLT